jgi:hypothetical protein
VHICTAPTWQLLMQVLLSYLSWRTWRNLPNVNVDRREYEMLDEVHEWLMNNGELLTPVVTIAVKLIPWLVRGWRKHRSPDGRPSRNERPGPRDEKTVE